MTSNHGIVLTRHPQRAPRGRALTLDREIMKGMEIQIQLLPTSKAVATLVASLLRLPEAKEVCIRPGPLRAKYVNVGIKTRSVRNLWNVLSPIIRSHKQLRDHSIITCEGRHGWDDYELIYHWKSSAINDKWK